MCALTELPHFQDLAQHLGQLDAAAAKRALVLVFPAAVLQDDLENTDTGISQSTAYGFGYGKTLQSLHVG